MPTSDDSDGTLIQAVLAGHADRFSEIVRRYQRSLARVAESQLACRDQAADAVQETFVAAYKSLSTYDSRYSFKTWLWTILLNECRRQYRQSKTRERFGAGQGTPVASLADKIDEHQPPPDTQLLAAEQRQLLKTLLAGLSDGQADAVRLRFFGGLKFQEIADVMDCSLPSAKARVRRGLSAMSDMMTTIKEKDRQNK